MIKEAINSGTRTFFMERMLIQLDQLLQISAFVTTAFIGDGGLVNVSVNGAMESR